MYVLGQYRTAASNRRLLFMAVTSSSNSASTGAASGCYLAAPTSTTLQTLRSLEHLSSF